jgi:RNA polymerase subunit RPABC4/transcription elongation factor Spt4
MQAKNEAQTGLTAEIRIVPAWAWTLAAVALIGGPVCFNLMLIGADAPAVWVRALLSIGVGVVLGCYFLLIGYVSCDARRRGMSPLLWTIVAVIITNGLGIILYFILRQPLQRTCPQCGNTVQIGFNFCPNCSSQLSPSCTKCHRVVGPTDIYCPYCGTSLNLEAVR